MDNATLNKWKTLANDAVIATFGLENREARLAQALEEAVEQINYLRSEWRPICDCGLHLQTYQELEDDGLI